MTRSTVTDQTTGMFGIDLVQQEQILHLLRNNGGKTSLELVQDIKCAEQSEGSPEQQLSYEDQIAAQILTEFPEITNILGRIPDIKILQESP